MNKDEILSKIKDDTFQDWYGNEIPENPTINDKLNEDLFPILDELVADGLIEPYETMMHSGYHILTANTVKIKTPEIE